MACYENITPFCPGGAATKTLAATGTTSNIQVATSDIYHCMLVYNAGTTDAFIELGETNAVTAAVASGMPIKGGTSRLLVFSKYVAVIFGTGTGNIYVTPGDGGV